MHSWICALMFLPFLLLLMWGAYSLQRWRLDQRKAAVNARVGQSFPRLPLLDSSGRPLDPAFASAAYTLVDCWFRDCPYCLAEMRQFSTLPGRDSLRILSISIDPPQEWQQVLRGADRRWAFLQEHSNSWQHAVVAPQGGGENPAAQMLADSLGVASYPSFFLVDREGRMVAAPASAMDWQVNARQKTQVWRFLTDQSVWSPWRYAAVGLLALLMYRQLLRRSRP